MSEDHKNGGGTKNKGMISIRSKILIGMLISLVVVTLALNFFNIKRISLDSRPVLPPVVFLPDAKPITSLMPSSLNHQGYPEITRVAAISEISGKHLFVTQHLLLPSWLHVTGTEQECPKSGNKGRNVKHINTTTSLIRLDLILAVEPDAMQFMPTWCIPIKSHLEVHPVIIRNPYRSYCFYANVSVLENVSYRFIHSLNFIFQEPVSSILDMGIYEYILRTDSDAVLFPSVLQYLPIGDGIVGKGFMGTEFTRWKLTRFAKTYMGLDSGKEKLRLFGLQSTFYLHKRIFKNFTYTLITYTNFIHDNGFIINKTCNTTEDNSQHPSSSKLCAWPHWFRDVSSLYATVLAANLISDDIHSSCTLDGLDTDDGTCGPRRSYQDLLHGHLLLMKYEMIEWAVSNLPKACSSIRNETFWKESKIKLRQAKSTPFARKFFEAYQLQAPLSCHLSGALYPIWLFIRNIHDYCSLKSIL